MLDEGRSELDVSAGGRSVDEVHGAVSRWLAGIGFTVLTPRSDGAPLKLKQGFISLTLHPRGPALVASLRAKGGASIVFEITTASDTRGARVHVEGYVIGVGLTPSTELQFQDSGLSLPGKQGARLLSDLAQSLRAVPTGEAALPSSESSSTRGEPRPDSERNPLTGELVYSMTSPGLSLQGVHPSPTGRKLFFAGYAMIFASVGLVFALAALGGANSKFTPLDAVFVLVVLTLLILGIIVSKLPGMQRFRWTQCQPCGAWSAARATTCPRCGRPKGILER